MSKAICENYTCLDNYNGQCDNCEGGCPDEIWIENPENEDNE